MCFKYFVARPDLQGCHVNPVTSPQMTFRPAVSQVKPTSPSAWKPRSLPLPPFPATC